MIVDIVQPNEAFADEECGRVERALGWSAGGVGGSGVSTSLSVFTY